MNKWHFFTTGSIEEVSFNVVLEKFYMLGIDGLVKEDIQNSLDASLKIEGKPVIVDIKIGTIKKSDIPGINEIEERIMVLKGYNEYTKETIEHMKKSIDSEEIYYISFEDSNTKGLSGAHKGDLGSTEDTWGIYAYKKGVHSIECDSEVENSRGGSHGLGKISANAASDLFLMFFANCDQEGNKHLGGTIQLVEHKYKNNNFRSTGYFTNTDNNNLIPFENEFSEEFCKNERGLKVIIPFLREGYRDEDAIIRSVCDNFFIAILKKQLIVNVNGKTLDENSIVEYIKNKEYYVQEEKNINKVFTPLYLDTYINTNPIELEIKSNNDVYKFDLYFRINKDIRKGRLAIVRTLGMKIEDKKIRANATKPFNGVLIPKSSKEDSFLKLLENESHSKIESEAIKDPIKKANAQKFINNISNELIKVINREIKR